MGAAVSEAPTHAVGEAQTRAHGEATVGDVQAGAAVGDAHLPAPLGDTHALAGLGHAKGETKVVSESSGAPPRSGDVAHGLAPLSWELLLALHASAAVAAAVGLTTSDSESAPDPLVECARGWKEPLGTGADRGRVGGTSAEPPKGASAPSPARR